MTHLHRRRTAVLATCCALLLAGCSGSPKRDATPTPTPSASPTPSPTPPAAALRSPLTGRVVASLGPVVAVKVDNAPLARPQSGLDKADVVYEEVVEGGTTRFVAIFSSQAAPVVGPVRSVRESDLELLRAYGRVLFAFSGGNAGVKGSVRRADVVDVSYDAAPSAYWRAGRRRDAINFMTSTANLFRARPGGARARDVGLRFGSRVAGAGRRAARTVSIVWSPRARTGFAWDAASKRWLRSMDGAPAMLRTGGRMSAPNVIVQNVRVTRSRYVDVTGSPSPYTVTLGSGTGWVLRDGVAIPVRWRRDGYGPTRYRDSAGRDVRLRPGPVWIVLAPTTASVTVA